MTTINQDLIEIRDQLDEILRQQKEALISKNVTLPVEMGLSDVPVFIRSINSGDINFIIDFSLIDQIGSPHTPRIGQASGGFDYVFTIKVNNDTSLLTVIDFTRAIPSQLHNFRQGQEGATSSIQPILNQNSNGIKNFNFKSMQQVPEVINYVDQVY